MKQEGLEIFAIFERPLDYPQGYVVRRSVVGGDRTCRLCVANIPHGSPERPCPLMDPEPRYAPDLLGARALIPPGKFRLPRGSHGPGDPPHLLETWL